MALSFVPPDHGTGRGRGGVMSLHADLLEQAKRLAQLDPRRPKQANLRRAISSAYYALFHLLAWEASAVYAVEPGMAARINRTLNHAEMKKASSMIANDKLPKSEGEGDIVDCGRALGYLVV